jgi:2-dehydro-3-deoxygluconokinase
MSYDVVTLGETMLRLTPPQFQRIEQAHQLEMHVGGSESNVVAGLSRLGLRTAWLSRLTANPVGRLIARQLQAQGVDVSHVVWTDEDRVGLYFLEEGKAPRGSQVIYDRADSAISQMRPDELPESLFQPGAARLLHLSGITPALGPNAAATTLHAAQLAKAAGWQFCFDINYRARLWSAEQAVQGCDPLAALADILILPLRDAVNLYGTPNDI